MLLECLTLFSRWLVLVTSINKVMIQNGKDGEMGSNAYLKVGRHQRQISVPQVMILAEERVGQLHRQPLLVILRLVFRHAEENSGSVGGC